MSNTRDRSTDGLLSRLDIDLPILAAPMAGGPSTVELVTAAAQVGALGFLAAGYKNAAQLADQIRQVRQSTQAFGVNVFAPNPVEIAAVDYDRYVAAIGPVLERFGVAYPNTPVEDDDDWDAKIDILLRDPVPVVSFTFGIPSADVVRGLRTAGSFVAQSVTNVVEASAAADAGVDLLMVQAAAAGGHSATLTPATMPKPVSLPELVSAIGATVPLPIVAGGGVSRPEHVAAALSAGAAAVTVGTALLRTPESGASAVHKAAIADAAGPDTMLTRAFSGRPARGIRNDFAERFSASAPLGYPSIHHLTSPLRKAGAAGGDPSVVNLWAGTGYRNSSASSAGEVLRALSSRS